MSAEVHEPPAAALGGSASQGAPTDRSRGRLRLRNRRLAAVAIVVALTLAGAAMALQRPAAEPQLVREGVAPAFDLERLRAPSERVALANLRGTPLVINFWASWCVPCRRETPVLNAVAAELAGKVSFVGINVQDEESPAETFDAIKGGGYPSGFDPSGEVGERYGVYGLPTTIFVAADGTIVGRRLGEVSETELRGLLSSAFGVASQEPGA